MAAQPSPLKRALLRRRLTSSSRQNHRKRHRHRRVLRDRVGRCVALLAAASVAMVLLCATLPAPTEDFGTGTTGRGGGGRNRNQPSRTSAAGAPAGHGPAGGDGISNSTAARDKKNYGRGTSTGGQERRGRGTGAATAVFQLRFHTRLLDVLLVSGRGGDAAGGGGYYYWGGGDSPHSGGYHPVHEPNPAVDPYYYQYHPGVGGDRGSPPAGGGGTGGSAHSRNEGCGGAARADHSGCTRMIDMDRGFFHDLDRLADDRGWPRGGHGNLFEFAAAASGDPAARGGRGAAPPAPPPRAGAAAAAVTAVLAEVYAQAGTWGAAGGGAAGAPPSGARGNGTAGAGDGAHLGGGGGRRTRLPFDAYLSPGTAARLGEVARHWSLARGEAVSWALALWDWWTLGAAAAAVGADDARTRRIVAAWWAMDAVVLLLVVASAARGARDRARRLWRSSRGNRKRQRRRPQKKKKPPRWRGSPGFLRLGVANLLRRISLGTGAVVAKFASREPPLDRSEEARPDEPGVVSNEESLERRPSPASAAADGGGHAREKAAPLRRLSSASLESDGSAASFPSRNDSFPSRNDAGPFASSPTSPEAVREEEAHPSGLPHRPIVEYESSSFFSTVLERGQPPSQSRGPPIPERGTAKPPLVSPPKPVRQTTWLPAPSRGSGPAAADVGSTAASGKKGKKKKKGRSASAAAGVGGREVPASPARPTRILPSPASKKAATKPPPCPVPTDAQREEAFRDLRAFQLRQVEGIVARRKAKGEGTTTRAPGPLPNRAPGAGSASSAAAEGLNGRLPPLRVGGDDVGAPGSIGTEELLGCDLLLSSILNDMDDDEDDDFETEEARDAPQDAVPGRAPDGGAWRGERTPLPPPPPGFASALHLNAAVPAIGAGASYSCRLSYQRVVVASTSSVTSSWGLGRPSAAASAAARPDSPPEATTLSGTAEWAPRKTHPEYASLHGLLNGGVAGGAAVAEERPSGGEGVSAVGAGGAAPCLTYAKLPFLGSGESFGNGNGGANGGDPTCHSELSQGSTAATASWGSSECSGGNVYDGNMW